MRLCFLLALLIGSAYGTSGDSSSKEDTGVPDNNNNIKWLTEISHIVRNPNYVDITLPRESFEEECYVRENGQLISANSTTLSGVKVQDNSNYVSCRITIGPMNENFVGTWELCGKSVSNGEIRCQRAIINLDRYAIFQPDIRRKHTHPVHFGGSVNSGVSGPNLITCHIITPAGEDLVLTSDVNYPHIKRSSASIANLCSVVIMDITRDMLGDWTIYARFSHPVFEVNEIHLPLTFELYNEDNPYEQAYNVSILDTQEHSVQVRTDFTIEVDQPLGVVEDCIFTTPSGKTFNTQNSTTNVPSGVYFSRSDSNALCSIHFSSITDEMDGEWQIIGKFRNEVLFDEKHRTFRIIVEHLLLSPINHFTRQQTLIDISLSKKSFEEECYIRPPNSNLLKAELFVMPGVKVQQKSQFVSCRITIGPMTENLLGQWRLCGKSVANQEIRCQPVHISWQSSDGSRDWTVQNRQTFIHPVNFGGSVHTGVHDLADVSTCHVITPAGEDLVISTDANYPHIEGIIRNIVCSIIFKDITRDMLGNWLVYGRFRSIFGQFETRFPLTFQLYNEEDPYEQAYNVTELPIQNHLIRVGTNLSVEVRDRGQTEDCIYTSPMGQIARINDQNPDVPNGVYINGSQAEAFCDIVFSPITEAAVGEWQIAAKFVNGPFYNERRMKFRVIEEDPENPWHDDIEREITYLDHRRYVNDIVNRSIIIAIALDNPPLVNIESCHLITPSGRQYALIDGFNVTHVEIIRNSETNCGIILSVVDGSLVGNWTIIGRGNRTHPTQNIERRLPFTIRVEENYVLQNDINIRRNADLYLHLHEEINVTETCLLYGPNGKEFTDYEPDPIHKDTCGYIVRNVNMMHNGTWVIEYGEIIKIRRRVDVLVIESERLVIENMQWSVGDSINISLGPEDTVYCIIQQASRDIMFDGFGQCKINVDRVTVDHSGPWLMRVGLPGSLRLQGYSFRVTVLTRSRDGLPLVSTSVRELNPSITLTCSVPIEHEVHACEFRDSRHNIFIAAPGVGQDGYQFNGTVSNYISGSDSHDCTLRIVNASIWDLGIWRCALDTSTGTHYGFLTVISPRLIENTGDSFPVITEPELRANSLTNVVGEPVTLSCSIRAPIRYCYFRAKNGTIYNVFPRMSSTENFEYFGAGLDAGDCGIRFKRLSPREFWYWTCHVGLVNTTGPELWSTVFSLVRERMIVEHYRQRDRDRTEQVVVQGIVSGRPPLDYCRFVKMNGHGFTSDNVPQEYEFTSTPNNGICALIIRYPDFSDFEPWTIVAKVTSSGEEISMTTAGIQFDQRNLAGDIFFWLIITIICLIPVVGLIAFIPKKNREWTSRRASGLRRSFRNSWGRAFAKKHTAQEHNNQNHT